MSDETDEFRLGHFDGLDGEVIPLSPALPTPPAPEAGDGSQTAVELKKASGVVRHPTVKSDPQAKFRSPREGMRFMELELSQIIPNEFQPRRVFNDEKLRELADSIRENGIIQPLVVMERPAGGFEILVGERRFRASKLAGLSKVPVFVTSQLPARTKLELALIENVQRADLNPIEEAKAYQQLHVEFGLSVREIGPRVGKNYSTVSNLIRLLGLPVEVQRALIDGSITEGQARPLLSLRDKEEMLAMFKIVRDRQMRSREVENRVREMRQKKIRVRQMFVPDPFIDSVENLLRGKLGTRVEVVKSTKGGKITIEFFSDEELNSIVGKIT